MILVSGAAGKTGRAVVQGLYRHGYQVRAWVHRQEQIPLAIQGGAAEAIAGSFSSDEDMKNAVSGVEAVYHICSNMNPNEKEIGARILRMTRDAGVEHFVYHSVFHPQISKMPHHWSKLQVEEIIFESGMNYTILQPAPYMQNLLAYLPRMRTEGVLAMPYRAEARLSLIDLSDLAEVVASVICNRIHFGATYELAGTGGLSQSEVAEVFSKKLGYPIRFETIPIKEWERKALAGGMDTFQRETLVKMFLYYDEFGMWGNTHTLESLLERKPTSLESFIDREIPNR